MFDIAINEDFDVGLDDRNDLATVEDRRAIEQSIAMVVNSYFYEEIGSVSATNAAEKIEIHTRQVVEENNYASSVRHIDVSQVTNTNTGAGGIRVSLVLDTGEQLDFTVGE